MWGSTTSRERERIRSYLRAELAEKAEKTRPVANGLEAAKAVRFLLVNYIEQKLHQSRPKRSRAKQNTRSAVVTK